MRREEILPGSSAEKTQPLCGRAAGETGRPNLFRSREHDIVFIGMVNVSRDGYLQGVVDVWRCRRCKKLFCEDRRNGEGLKPDVGFEEIPDDEQWAILTCTDIKGVFMQSLPIKPGKRLEHTCRSEERLAFAVKEAWSIDSAAEEGKTIHRLYMVKDHLNSQIEAGYYKLRMLKGVPPGASEKSC